MDVAFAVILKRAGCLISMFVIAGDYACASFLASRVWNDPFTKNGLTWGSFPIINVQVLECLPLFTCKSVFAFRFFYVAVSILQKLGIDIWKVASHHFLATFLV